MNASPPRNTVSKGSPDPAGACARDSDGTICPRCGESRNLAKVKGCVKCLSCGFKFDCNGW